MKDTTTTEDFKFWVPAQIAKGGAAKDGKRWVQGIASTDSRDLQGEVVNQLGLDINYFLKSGFFNYDHKPGVENKVGEPTECKVTKNGLWVKGFLYEGKKTADDIWEHMTATERQSRRKMGFSIEGKVVKRNGHVIEKAWIQDIAITPSPVNTNTWAEIAKSLSACEWDMSKAMSADCNSELIPESLDEEEKDLKKIKDEKDVKKSFTFDETVSLLKSRGLSEEDSTLLTNYIFQYQETK